MCLHPVLTNQLQSILSFKSKSLIRGMHNIKLNNPEGTLWFIHAQSGFLLWRRACWFAAGALKANVEKTILICIQGFKNCVTSRRFSSVQTSFIFLFLCRAADFGISAQITATLARRMSFIGTPYWWETQTFTFIINFVTWPLYSFYSVLTCLYFSVCLWFLFSFFLFACYYFF